MKSEESSVRRLKEKGALLEEARAFEQKCKEEHRDLDAFFAEAKELRGKASKIEAQAKDLLKKGREREAAEAFGRAVEIRKNESRGIRMSAQTERDISEDLLRLQRASRERIERQRGGDFEGQCNLAIIALVITAILGIFLLWL